jgi:hypothetical protein
MATGSRPTSEIQGHACWSDQLGDDCRRGTKPYPDVSIRSRGYALGRRRLHGAYDRWLGWGGTRDARAIEDGQAGKAHPADRRRSSYPLATEGRSRCRSRAIAGPRWLGRARPVDGVPRATAIQTQSASRERKSRRYLIPSANVRIKRDDPFDCVLRVKAAPRRGALPGPRCSAFSSIVVRFQSGRSWVSVR